ncbi:ABC transporter permease [Marinobacter salexigens]|uniref:Transport permease protein n=2 Tax=Marinobacter TaxID=2742 RepID=A0ABS6AC33_9GAMM|nr:ABC transporter permease [Marinobacter salexigens]MBU2875730.1 ABC transporter permease [Marinobacter salexigens]
MIQRALAIARYWWSYRFFVRSAIRNDLRARYARSKLGLLWALVQPLAMVLIYTLILSHLMSAKLPETDTVYAYPIYLMSGMLAWTLFSEAVGRGLGIFVEQGELIKKVAFPRALLPIIALGSATVNGLALLSMMLMVFLFLGHWPDLHYLWMPGLMFLALWLGLSIGLLFGLMNVFFRDISQAIPVILQFLFWLTPIVYALSMLPPEYHSYFSWNPIAKLTAAFQDVILYRRNPTELHLVYLSGIAFIFTALSAGLYLRVKHELADHL